MSAGPSSKPAFVPLDDVGLLRFAGPDVIGFLQGYLTSDATELGADPKFTAMCDIRGRAVCSGFAWLEGQDVALALHRSLCAPLEDFLRPYLLFSKTRLSDETPDALVLGALGDVEDADFPSLARRLDDARHLCVLARDGPVEVNAEAQAARVRWDLAQIERREVWLTAETTGAFLPQMIALDEMGAVSFSEGLLPGPGSRGPGAALGRREAQAGRVELDRAPAFAGRGNRSERSPGGHGGLGSGTGRGPRPRSAPRGKLRSVPRLPFPHWLRMHRIAGAFHGG